LCGESISLRGFFEMGGAAGAVGVLWKAGLTKREGADLITWGNKLVVATIALDKN